MDYYGLLRKIRQVAQAGVTERDLGYDELTVPLEWTYVDALS